MSKIVLTGGGTAGHVTPCLALLPYLKKEFDEIYYLGSYDGIEKRLAQKEGIKYYGVSTVKLKRNFSLSNLSIPLKLIKGIKESSKILNEIKPDVIFSKGGFVSVPVVIAGARKKIPVISHESDFTVGLANKITSKYCKKVLTSFPETAKTLSNGNFVGAPLREEIFKKQEDAYSYFNLSGKKPVLLILGGSQGSKSINDVIFRVLDELLPTFDVIHVVGKGNVVNVNKQGYAQVEYLEDVSLAYSIASVCVSRAGSNTVFELLALKIPTLLIPLPKGTSRGDQVFNAEYFEKLGLVSVLPQSRLTEKSLTLYINATYSNRFNLKRNLDKYPVENACPKILETILNYTL